MVTETDESALQSTDGTAEGGPASANEHETPFIAYLRRLHEAKDRGALAALRRGLGKPAGTEYAMYPYVAPWLTSGAHRSRDDAHFLIAALFAFHPEAGGRGNLGEAFRRAIASPSDRDAIERRFTALLAADPEEFDYHLRHAVAFLRAKDVAIEWSQLLRDVQDWRMPDGRVQRRWARSFWARTEEENEGFVSRES